MSADHRERHAELILAAINAESLEDRMDDRTFRDYVISLCRNLDLPRPNHLKPVS